MRNEAASKNLVIISDLHQVHPLSVCHPDGFRLDGGGRYKPSKLQKKLYEHWKSFWSEWVPLVTRRKGFVLCLNGDALEGRHHGSTDQPQNLAVHSQACYDLLEPVVKRAEAFYFVRGTEAHGGPSGEDEERLASALNAVKTPEGMYTFWEVWFRLGKGLVHVTHHIGTSSSMAYEVSALGREISNAASESARWGLEMPDFTVRSHRHRYDVATMPGKHGQISCITTPGWQLKTSYTFRHSGARNATPQVGGILIKAGDEDPIYHRPCVWNMPRPKEVVL